MAPVSSAGVTNFCQSCVPRGSQRSTYSAPTMASAKARMVRLMVAMTRSPPGATAPQQAAVKARMSGTCSTTSMASTTSKRSPAATTSSTVWVR
jgi:hypothetical protein